MDTPSPEKIINALKLMTEHLGVVSTIGEDGAPESAVVYFDFDDKIGIYFMAQAESRKYKNILHNPKVAFAIYSANPARTIQIKGEAGAITDEKEKASHLEGLQSAAKAKSVLPPVNQIGDISGKSEIVVVKITPTWARLGDFDIYREHNMFHEAESA